MTRPIKIALAISVVLNMLLGGMLLGDLCRLVVGPSSFDMEAHLSKLPPDKLALFENILVPAKKNMDTQRVKIDEAKKEALHILSADHFDGQAYLSQIQHINDLQLQMKLQVAKAVVELANKLSQEERAVVAEVISHPPFAASAPHMRPESHPKVDAKP